MKIIFTNNRQVDLNVNNWFFQIDSVNVAAFTGTRVTTIYDILQIRKFTFCSFPYLEWSLEMPLFAGKAA